MKSFSKVMRNRYKENKRSAIIIYFVLKILVIICGVLSVINGNYRHALICLLALLLFTLQTVSQNTFKF